MQIQDLGGAWRVRSACGHYSFSGQVPGSLFGDLETQGHFGPGGIAWRENNRQCQDIADRDFTWEREFEPDPGLLDGAGPVMLECDGLDTLATITVNGQVVANTANMHRRYAFPVGHLLRPGRNVIDISFANALQHCRDGQKRRPIWFAYDKTPEIAFGGFNMIRKSHCSFGWDWGPIVPDVGIWRPIRLVCYDTVRIADLRVAQRHTAAKVELDIAVALEAWTGDAWQVPRCPAEAASLPPVRIAGSLAHPGGATQEFSATPDGEGITRVTVQVSQPQLWWPNGLGEQPLYQLEVRLEAAAGSQAGDPAPVEPASPPAVVDRRHLNLGLRTLRVRREPDQWGESFEFEVNGLSVFACGADWIPEDLSLPRVGADRTEALIRDAAAANFNCLRVWGGGVYPSNEFFGLCDRYGLIVWQDLMFACALYDINDPEFRANVMEELRDNLRRIRHHACLGLVCGNNEMEVAFVEWGLPDVPATKTEYLLQYQHLFPEAMAREAPEVYYWPASPSSGGDFLDPNNPDKGDCHFWAVWHGNKDFSEYTRHYFRFMSEFGFESYPALKTIEGFTEPGDRDIYSPVMEDHQRCVGGNAKIMTYLSRYFRSPRDLAATVYLSWVSQAEALRHGIEHWRRHRGRCMGAVYWQFNDNWPVASWSSVDFAGRWKALHYQARRSFAPILLSACIPDPANLDEAGKARLAALPKPAGNGHWPTQPALVEIHLSNEGREAVAARLSWELLGFDGAILAQGEAEAAVAAFSSARALELDLSATVNGRDLPRRCLLACQAVLSDGRVLDVCQLFVPPKQLALPEPGLSVRVVPYDPVLDRLDHLAAGTLPPRWTVVVSSDRPALFAAVDHRSLDLVLSDNFVFLDGKRPRRLAVERIRRDGREVEASLEEMVTKIHVRSLRDSLW
jgi:beta-mannosidase